VGSRGTVGRIRSVPGGTNVISSSVEAWLDARAETEVETRLLVADIERHARDAAAASGCSAAITEESWADAVHFDGALSKRLGAALGPVPLLATGAGHDAGVLAAYLPTAMLFVRNPTGISHSPEEFATTDDCIAGINALETLLKSVL
jgi:N-carbamoyl-L-amino-acid hydrolase